MARTNWLLAIVLLFGARIAAAEPTYCPHAEIAKTRQLADQKMKARDYASAVEILRALRSKCALWSYKEEKGERKVDLDFYWIHSDLSLALYRAGKFQDCLAVLAPLTYPGPPDGMASAGLDGEPVARAVEYNERLCESALTKRYDKLADKPCAGIARNGDDDRSSIAVPGELSQGGRFSCLRIEGGAEMEVRKRALEGDKEPDAKKLCPHLVAMGPSGKNKVTIELGAGTLLNVNDCCLIDSIAAGVVDGKHVVRLRGQGRDCFGGRAYVISDEIYEWKGSKLTLISDASRIAH